MRAMVFVDRSGAALAPLDRQYTTALLPVVDKPLIQYRLEELIEAGITDCLFVLSDHADKLETFLGRGERWGARFRFALSRGGEAPSAVSRRIDIGDDEPLLVLRADLMASPSVGRFLESAAGIHGDQVLGAAEDSRASLVLLRSGHGDAGELLDQLHWTPDGGSDAALPQVASVDLSSVMVNPIASLADYHRANLDLVAKRIPGVTPGGREVALGLTAGRRAIASPKSLKQGQAYVGENSRVSPEAEFLGEVVICRDVVVDRAATISDSVILPYSYIGELVEVTKAIIAHDILIRVDSGAVIKIADAFLLGRIGDDSGAPPGPRLWYRLVGGLLLLLSLPLWPLALIAALVGARGSARKMLQPEVLVGNRPHSGAAGNVIAGDTDRAFRAWRFQTGIPALSMLPRLLAVVAGDLAPVGVEPLTPEQAAARTEDWQRVRDQAPVGLFGPTQLTLPREAPSDERLMSDAFYVGHRSLLTDLRWLWNGLLWFFSRRAWERG